MKSIKNWRRADGFTLVELVVVIAIIAILAGIGVPSYTKYIDASKMSADKALASEVGNAMQLHYYGSKGANFTGVSYVILTQEGLQASDAFAVAAMEKAFGSDWATNALQFDGWTAKFTGTAADGAYGDVADSTFVKKVGTAKLMKDVQKCTNGLTSFLNTALGGDVDAAKSALSTKLGSGFDTILDDAKFADGEMTADALANATVFAVSDWTKNNSAAATQYFSDAEAWTEFAVTGDVYAMASWYAASESMVNYLDPTGKSEAASLLNSITKAGEEGNMAALNAAVKSLQAAVLEMGEENPTAFASYYGLDMETGEATGGQAAKDASAYTAMMGAVSDAKEDYTTADDLLNPDLVTSGEVASGLNSYVAGAQLQNVMDSLPAEEKSAMQAALAGADGIVYLIQSGNTITAAVDLYQAG